MTLLTPSTAKYTSYLIRLSDVSPSASQEAAADAAAHEVLVALYPTFKTQLDVQLQQLLAEIPDGQGKTDGIVIGVAIADQILALRHNDGSNNPPIPYIFGTAPGDYQSTPPNFPPQPQFTHWSKVTPFALDRANQFRPGAPPALNSDEYSDVFNEIKSLGVANSTTATPDEALTAILEWGHPELLERKCANGVARSQPDDRPKCAVVCLD